MNELASVPPSKQRKTLDGFFQGGMMPATEQNIAALIVIDIRSLRLSKAKGKKLELELREFLFERLGGMKVDLANRSAVDLSSAVFGISID